MFTTRPEFGFNVSPQTAVPGFRVSLPEDPPGFRINQDRSVRHSYAGTPARGYHPYGNVLQPSELLAALIVSNPFISQGFRGSAAWGDLGQRSKWPPERSDVSDQSILGVEGNPQPLRNAQMPDNLRQRCIRRCADLIIGGTTLSKAGNI